MMYLFAELGQENILGSLFDFRSNLINWLLLVAIVYWLVKKFVPGAISSRQQLINNELAAAKKTREDAEKALEEQKQQLKEAAKAAEQIVVEARHIAKQMSEEVKQQTEVDSASLLKKFETAVHNERQAAIIEMRSVVAKAAIKLAQENLQTVLTADNKAKIGQEFMGELSKMSETNLNGEELKKNSFGNHESKQVYVNSAANEQNLVDS